MKKTGDHGDSESSPLALSQCLRRCDDLESQLINAIGEQNRIRQMLQTRLLDNQQNNERVKNELVAQMELEKMNFLSQLQQVQETAACLKLEQETRLQQTNQDFQERVAAIHNQYLQIQKGLETSLSDATAIIAELGERLAAIEGSRIALSEQIRSIKARLHSTEGELRAVYHSLSWRIGAPLRWLGRPFSRSRKR